MKTVRLKFVPLAGCLEDKLWQAQVRFNWSDETVERVRRTMLALGAGDPPQETPPPPSVLARRFGFALTPGVSRSITLKGDAE